MVAVAAMREEALAPVEPDALDGIELGAARGQWQQGDVGRQRELGSEVPAGLIEEQAGVHAGRELLGEGCQKHGHRLCRGAWQGQGKGFAGAGPADGEQIYAPVALVGDPR